MNYAVIQVGGKQHKVSVGTTFKVDAKLGEEKQKIEFDKVLLTVAEDKVAVGKPLVKAKVSGTIVSIGKAKKVRIMTYKAKTGQHRSAGHRQDQSTVKIDEIKEVK